MAAKNSKRVTTPAIYSKKNGYTAKWGTSKKTTRQNASKRGSK